MAKAKVKPIHLTILRYNNCKAACDNYLRVGPIEAVIKRRSYVYDSKGTFNPKKVTCKRCLKHSDYKEAMDKIKYPLFFLKEGIV